MLDKSRISFQNKMFRCNQDCVVSYAKRKVPIVSWVKNYKLSWLARDAVAGFTVGLTAIPQGIAYGVVAQLGPEYGLYSAFMASFVYIFIGTCKSITIGPTAIMATMVAPLVLEYGADIAVLLTFLKGCVITILGLFHLGFLLDFISLPVITGFTAAASVNIAASQFKSLLGIPGRSEDLVDALVSIFSNLSSIRYQDVLLGVVTIVVLVLLKNLPGRRTGTWPQKIAWMTTLARNALVVIAGTVVAYIFYIYNSKPFNLTGTLGDGLPPIGPPPFTITAKNRTYDFLDTLSAMGTTVFTIPIISTIEHMAIAKACAMGKSFDATDEMFALGVCNIFGSFVRSMPVTGSFTRSVVNKSSGVKTPFGGFFTGGLVLLASSLLTSTFYFIPKATLAGLIICAMYYMLEFKTYIMMWHAKKIDFFLMLLTFLLCVFYKLEWGILIGIGLNLLVLLYFSARPSIKTETEQVEDKTVITVVPEETIAFPAAEYFRLNVLKLAEENPHDIVLDCKHLKRIDVTVAKNLKLLANDLQLRGKSIVCKNRESNVETLLKTVAPEL